MGIDSRVGSIEVGKDADFAIFSHHPLSIYAVNQLTIVDGKVVFDNEKDADDMRLNVSPEGVASPVILHQHNHNEEESCMRNTAEFLLDLKD